MGGQSASIKTQTIGSTATWFPEPSTLTGTFNSEGRTVRGLNSLLMAEAAPGDFLIDSTNHAHEIHEIKSNTLLTLVDAGFGSNLMTETCRIVKNYGLRSLKVIFTGGAGTVISADQVAKGDTPATIPQDVLWETKRLDGYFGPYLIDAASAATVEITY